jgi:hypothetical protein
MKRQHLIAILACLGLLGAASAWLYLHGDSRVGDQAIHGTVTEVTNRPNRAEDGYYAFKVQDGAGHVYTVDATGYLNTPLAPESRGEACVVVPPVKVGDKVTFNLPPFDGWADAFGICYKQSLVGYYFRLD